MAYIVIDENQPLFRTHARSVIAECPECAGELAVLRVIAGRAGCEYWAMRCTDCGGIHLDIHEPFDGGSLPAA